MFTDKGTLLRSPDKMLLGDHVPGNLLLEIYSKWEIGHVTARTPLTNTIAIRK